MSDTRRVDLNAPGTNMFGILPCPECASSYRWPHQDGRLICDDCRYEEQGIFVTRSAPNAPGAPRRAHEEA